MLSFNICLIRLWPGDPIGFKAFSKPGTRIVTQYFQTSMIFFKKPFLQIYFLKNEKNIALQCLLTKYLLNTLFMQNKSFTESGTLAGFVQVAYLSDLSKYCSLGLFGLVWNFFSRTQLN